MTAPAVVDGGNSMTMEEIEESIAAPVAPPKLEEVKLEGEEVPEAFRGKTAAELLASNKAMETALRLSESARIALEHQAPAPAAPAPVAAEPAPQMTREQLQEIYEQEPLRAIAIMNDMAIQQAARHYEARIASMETGSASSAEANAKSKYADEFSLLGKEIEEVRRSVPDQSIFSQPKAWDDLVSYVRGQPANFDKLVEHKALKGRTPEAARTEQEADSGFSPAPVSRSAPIGRIAQLDPIQKEIAATLGMSESDYIKWNNIGARS